jgi:hypothetical protein
VTRSLRSLPIAGLLPSLLLSALLIASTQPTPAADRGPTVQMTVTPIR